MGKLETILFLKLHALCGGFDVITYKTSETCLIGQSRRSGWDGNGYDQLKLQAQNLSLFFRNIFCILFRS